MKKFVALAAIAAAVSLMGLPAAAGAAPERVVEPFKHFYDSAEAGIVVTTGGPVEAFCSADGGVPMELSLFARNDGTLDLKSQSRDVAVYVYQFDGPAPALVGIACDALDDGDPSTSVPEPWAVGTGGTQDHQTNMPPEGFAGAHIVNSFNGTATSVDGSTWKVKASVDLFVGDDGAPVGDPAEFQTVSIKRIRHGR